MSKVVEFKHFLDIDIRAGTIIHAEVNNLLNKPSMILKIDFGNTLGIKKSLAQLTANYRPDKILNKQVLAVINFQPKQIGHFISEVLVLGFPDDNGEPILLSPDKKVNNGVRLY